MDINIMIIFREATLNSTNLHKNSIYNITKHTSKFNFFLHSKVILNLVSDFTRAYRVFNIFTYFN